jgi:prepilin-type N-terminal cleavage/methylation domain-containing protein
MKRAGLSLIELVIVVLVMGIIAAIISIRFTDSLTHHRLDSAAKLVAQDVQTAANGARTRSTPVTVVFDTTAEKYTFTGLEHPSRPGKPYVVDVKDIWNVEIESTDFKSATPLKINAFGYVEKRGKVKLRIGTGKTDNRELTVTETGEVEVKAP